jgi:hypothetical protein
MTAPTDLLLLWRTAPASTLLADRDLPGALLAFLAGRLEPRDAEEKTLLDRALRGGDRGRAAFALAGRFSEGAREVPDMASSWALLAALNQHDPAAVALAQVLHERADELRERWRHESKAKTAQALRREADVMDRMALDWSRRTRLSILKRASWWRDALTPTVEEEGIGEAPMRTARAERADGSPTLHVISEVGFPETEEGSVVAAYRSLTEPLPLQGGRVAPAVLETALTLEFPHMAEAVDRVVEDLLLLRRAGVPWARFRPLLLVGAPGTGKTRFARRVAEFLGTGHGELGVGGVSDNRLLEGTARGWRDAQPCWPLLVMRQAKAANPVLLVDEIDKATAGRNGDVRATLLSMLEPQTARSWFDSCILAPADLSQISWILTANAVDNLPRPLLSRLRVVRVERPGLDAFDGIFAAILRDIATELSINQTDLPALPDKVVAVLQIGFARGAGVRELKRAVEAALARAEPASRRLN